MLTEEQREKRYNDMLLEFLLEKDLNKFSGLNKTLKFKNGSLMGRWYCNNRKRISLSEDNVSLKVKEQLNKKKQKKEAISKEQRIINDETFNNKVLEFYLERSLDKYVARNGDLRFKDNTVMFTWFSNNKNRILNSDDNICKLIKKQYFEEYLKCSEKTYYLKQKGFEDKLLEFLNEEDLNKFNLKNRTLKFKSGTIMSVWFNNYKNRIIKLNNEISDDVMMQYLKYYNVTLKEPRYERLYKRAEEFYKEKNIDKYNIKNENIIFKDNIIMSVWFVNNKHIIFNSDNMYCIKIKEEYENKFLPLVETSKMEKKKNRGLILFEEKLEEFTLENDLNKFNSGNKVIKFKNGSLMGNWFNMNKNMILYDRKCEDIIKQYCEYKNIDVEKFYTDLEAKKNKSRI